MSVFEDSSENYKVILNKSLSVTGENSEYFARTRIQILIGELKKINCTASSVMDFGFGDTISTDIFLELFNKLNYTGLEDSHEYLKFAKQKYHNHKVQFFHDNEFKPDGTIELVYCNGGFHHIHPDNRPSNIKLIHKSLRNGGLFSLWENNPLNPGTNYIMSRTPFDKNAFALTANESKKLLIKEGFQIVSIAYYFFFPRILNVLRPFEKFFSWIPLGGQYQIIAKK